MPTNANTFNSRVTSEALEAKFRQVFPSQGGAELSQDLFASGVIQPVIDFSTVAEGSALAPNLQTAWDFSTGVSTTTAGTTNLISNTGFWKVDLTCTFRITDPNPRQDAQLQIWDGSSGKTVWAISTLQDTVERGGVSDGDFVVFLRAGDVLRAVHSGSGYQRLDVWWRQIADVNGNLVNPLGFTFS